MSTIIKTYRHSPNYATDPTGTLVDTETDPDDGDFAVTVDSTGWNAGSYEITVKATMSGYSESLNSNAVPLTVNAAGISDNFNRANGALGANWSTPAWSYGGNIVVSGNTAIPGSATVDMFAARWAGTALGNNHTVIARLGPGAVNSGDSAVVARMYDGGNLIKAARSTSAGGSQKWTFEALIAGVSTGYLAIDPLTDSWGKIVCADTTATFYTSADGATWGTAKHTITDAGLTFSAQPGIVFWTGFGTTGTAATVYADDFSAV